MAAKLIWETGRLYENEDILVIHNIMVVPDGSKEARGGRGISDHLLRWIE